MLAPWFLDLLACTSCGSRLDQPGEGELRCQACATSFVVRDGIPRFVPAENYATNFGLQWNHFRQTQLDSHSGHPITRNRFLSYTGWTADDLKGALVLDVGCGAGRFTEIALSMGVTVVAMDYSSAVEACRQNHAGEPRLGVVQGDIYAMPFRRGAFDRVYCFGVLQHTPAPAAAFRALLMPLAPGGQLAMDVYARQWWRFLASTYYWVRPITRRLPPRVLYAACRRYIEAAWRISGLLGRLPLGRRANQALLIADYRGAIDLTDDALREWAILDTFDHLAPRYDRPQRLSTVRRWFEEAGLEDVDIRYGHNGVQGRARKPAP